MAEMFNLSDPAHRALVPDGACLLAYRGSIAHNMYVPGTDPNSIDDVDLMGVVVGEERHYLGLEEWGSRGTREVKEGQYDCVFYEIKKMVSLLLQGNPNVLSILWLRPEDYLILKGPDWLSWNTAIHSPANMSTTRSLVTPTSSCSRCSRVIRRKFVSTWR